jgi:tetratricopeptide (TPR) repeat protein
MTCTPFPLSPNESDFNDDQLLFERGEFFFNKRQYEEALECYDQYLELKPDNVQAWLCHGGTLTHLDRYAESVISFEVALQLEPDNQIALLYKGFALQHIGQYEKAYMYFDRAGGIERSSLATRLHRWGHKILNAIGFGEK